MNQILLIDIGANLTDPMFQGMYNSSVKHPADYKNVLQRAWKSGLDKIIITVGTINEADEALKFASEDGIPIVYLFPISKNDFLTLRSIVHYNGMSSN